MYDGKDDSATALGTFCGSNIPTVFTSGDKNLYIVYTSTDASNSFKASWKKVTSKFEIKYQQPVFIFLFLVTCCATVSVSSENSEIMGAYGSYLFGMN